MLLVLEVSGLIEQPCLVLSCTSNELAGTRVAAVRLVQCPEQSPMRWCLMVGSVWKKRKGCLQGVCVHLHAIHASFFMITTVLELLAEIKPPAEAH